ncbi:hypothetical protein T265_00604 [Opisthorchis viverrini]|uniref:Uncharacterized protein n=1 Tax=Opisthorchis viverrini TaxID=6198 RepID=A0A075A184_OPIVI|nr:hypothetical protein T265_00604 [Opisthorchis viverrini]KER33488.1 hypothetical protein T265_00604 [Opisthorchis viverrini]
MFQSLRYLKYRDTCIFVIWFQVEHKSVSRTKSQSGAEYGQAQSVLSRKRRLFELRDSPGTQLNLAVLMFPGHRKIPTEQLQTISGQGSKIITCNFFLQKLNIHLLLERVFLNFSELSLKCKQMLQSDSTNSYFSRDVNWIYEETYYSHAPHQQYRHYNGNVNGVHTGASSLTKTADDSRMCVCLFLINLRSG